MTHRGVAQGHCSGQRLDGQLTRWPGPRGPQCAYTLELKRGCKEAVTWAEPRLPILPLLSGLEKAHSSQMLAKAVPCRHPGVQEKHQALQEPGSTHWKPEMKIPFSSSTFFRALNLEKAKEKYLKALIHFHRSGNKG